MKKFVSVILIVFFFTGSSFALISDRVKFEQGELKSNLEKDFFRDLDKGTLSSHDFYDAFLIASGITDPAEFASRKNRLVNIREKAVQELGSVKDENQKAKNLLLWLHDNVLRKYVSSATLASDILDKGQYNCLSASILYAVLANDIGLDVKGVIVKDHAFCMLESSDGETDIETTIRYGFSPGTEEIQQLKEVTHYIYVPKKEYARRRTVTILQLIGAMYSNLAGAVNRAEGEEEKIDCTDSLPKYKKGYYFDQGSIVFKTDIEACLNNMAIKLLETKEFEQVYVYIRQAKAFDPSNEDFKNLEKKMFSERADAEIKNGNFEKGVSYVRSALIIYPSDEKLVNNLAYCYVSWGNSYFEKQGYEEAAQKFAEGLKEVPKNEVLLEGARAAYYNSAVAQYNKRDFKRAEMFADKGLDISGEDKELQKIKQASVDAQRQ